LIKTQYIKSQKSKKRHGYIPEESASKTNTRLPEKCNTDIGITSWRRAGLKMKTENNNLRTRLDRIKVPVTDLGDMYDIARDAIAKLETANKIINDSYQCECGAQTRCGHCGEPANCGCDCIELILPCGCLEMHLDRIQDSLK